MEYTIETESDLAKLIGQYESIRLEFKRSALLTTPKDKIIENLTKEASAFANTEGGLIVIGIGERESRGKSIGAEIDEGVDPTVFPLINSNSL